MLKKKKNWKHNPLVCPEEAFAQVDTKRPEGRGDKILAHLQPTWDTPVCYRTWAEEPRNTHNIHPTHPDHMPTVWPMLSGDTGVRKTDKTPPSWSLHAEGQLESSQVNWGNYSMLYGDTMKKKRTRNMEWRIWNVLDLDVI